MADADSLFDKVMEAIGDRGFFQRRFNYIYNFGAVLFSGMVYMNIILAMSIPEHWCHVPGRNETNYTKEEWKAITIPKENQSSGVETYSSCRMFNISMFDEDLMNVYYPMQTTTCQFGYEYDTTWFLSTIPSQEDWVCEKELHVTNALSFSRIGEVFGTFVFGQLADRIGRRPVFYITAVLCLTGRLIMTFTTSWYSIFVVFVVLSVVASQVLLMCPTVIQMEISRSEDRGLIGLIQLLAYTTGIGILPLLMWWLRDWFHYILISTIPIGIFLFLDRFMIESPRWLYNRQRISKCIEVLKNIAKVNGTVLTNDALALLHDNNLPPKKSDNIMSLFSNWRLAKNCILTALNWSVYNTTYFVLYLNVANLAGNPFLNFFYQTIAEIPSLLLGRICCDKFGRRWTALGAFLLAGLTSFGIYFIINNPELSGYSAWICIFVKFFLTFIMLTATLQAVEIYPTSLRQTGLSLCSVVGNLVAATGPYIVFVGTSYDARYPYLIMGAILCLGAITQIFLPETLNHKLPETLADAYVFGKDQPYWGLPKKNANVNFD